MNTRKLACATVITAALLSSCTTVDPYSREEKTSQATKGALIGAAAGVVAGLITGDGSMERKKRALIGAGVGALAGGAVGAYQDRQEAKLRAELEGTGVSVTRIGDNITLNMPGNVTFAVDSADLRPAFFEVLNSVAVVLEEFDQTVIEVAGHTDSTGSDDYNLSLSQRRSAAVARYLATQGINSQRMIQIGLGEQYPVADNATAEGRQLNRRVEITVVPLTS